MRIIKSSLKAKIYVVFNLIFLLMMPVAMYLTIGRDSFWVTFIKIFPIIFTFLFLGREAINNIKDWKKINRGIQIRDMLLHTDTKRTYYIGDFNETLIGILEEMSEDLKRKYEFKEITFELKERPDNNIYHQIVPGINSEINLKYNYIRKDLFVKAIKNDNTVQGFKVEIGAGKEINRIMYSEFYIYGEDILKALPEELIFEIVQLISNLSGEQYNIQVGIKDKKVIPDLDEQNYKLMLSKLNISEWRNKKNSKE